MADKIGTITVDVEGLEVFIATVDALVAAMKYIDSMEDKFAGTNPNYFAYESALKELERIAAENETDGE